MADALADLLQAAIDRAWPEVRGISEEQAGRPSKKDRWTPKQELGHLIDSAANNHMRFVRASLDGEYRGPAYDQEKWVDAHGYAATPWDDLLEFWRRYNDLLVQVVRRIPDGRLTVPCFIGSYPEMTLGFVIEDYVRHMQHHLDQLLGRDQAAAYPSAT